MLKVLVSIVIISIISSCSSQKENSDPYQNTKDYPNYGGSKSNTRFSALDQITAENVNKLSLIWQTYVNDSSNTSPGEIQCQPIAIDGILYGTSTELNLVALDGASGKIKWIFKPYKEKKRHPNRGVTYYENGSDKRILYTVGYYIYAVNAIDGTSITSFGDSGTADLRAGLNEVKDISNFTVNATSPGIVFKNIFIIGSSVSEGDESAPGYIRAYDILSGKLKWVFRTIPLPGEYGYDTWPKDAYKKFGGTNNWGGMSVDDKRGVVYFGTGSPSSDYYGGERAGANLFANCILALDAETGIRKWHFQAIHHDLWDRDFPCPPNLTTITRDGKKIDVVVQVGKDGYTWILDRDSGKSIYPVEEIEVPTDGLPGEQPFPTQPQPSKPLPTMRQTMSEKDITTISPEANEFVKKRLASFPITNHRYTPPREKGTVLFGYSGGAEWGGTAVDNDGILYVNSNEFPWELKMISKEERNKKLAKLTKGHALYISNCASCHGADRNGNGTLVPELITIGRRKKEAEISEMIKFGNARMPAFPYIGESQRIEIARFLLGIEKDNKIDSHIESFANQTKDTSKNEYRHNPSYVIDNWQRFVDPNGYNPLTPPWGTLNAIDLNTGDYVWRVPLGEYPELSKKGIPITGTETYGGPVVTASGLLFIASTRDEKLRAINKHTGKTIWEYQLPAGGFSSCISYEIKGVQYIALAVGGGRGAKPGGWYMAFALK